MELSPRALIVDDDIDAAEYLKFRLRQSIPQLHVETRTEPDVSGQFDMYFLDNDFAGEKCAGSLAQRISGRRGESLVIAFSAYLDIQTLKQLINAGCDGACEKHKQSDVEQLIGIARSFLDSRLSASERGDPKRGFLGTLRSITDLLREWNRRLDNQAKFFDVDSRERTPEAAQHLFRETNIQ